MRYVSITDGRVCSVVLTRSNGFKLSLETNTILDHNLLI